MKKKIASNKAPAGAVPRRKESIRHNSCGELSIPTAPPLFDRVAAILDAARSNVVRAVNSQMVIANWLIGREITQELQGGDDRAEYGKNLMRAVAQRLTERFDKGFSLSTLHYFRQFYQVYPDRILPILHKPCGESPPPSSATRNPKPSPVTPCSRKASNSLSPNAASTSPPRKNSPPNSNARSWPSKKGGRYE